MLNGAWLDLSKGSIFQVNCLLSLSANLSVFVDGEKGAQAMEATQNFRVIVEDLVQELASLLADRSCSHWDGFSGESTDSNMVGSIADRCESSVGGLSNNQRKSIVAAAMYHVGNNERGIPSIALHVLKIVAEQDITIYGLKNDLPPVAIADISENLGLWYMTPEDAETVRDRLLPDKLKAARQEKLNAGRYTLGEAADRLEEEFICGEDDGPLEGGEIREQLLAAAATGALPVYWPGREDRYEYENADVSTCRENYEEVKWSDLNEWLKKSQHLLAFSFPTPEAHPTDTRSARGLSKSEILSVVWPLPLSKGVPSLDKILSECSDWVLSARVCEGRRGGGKSGSHLWNPVQLAICLNETTSHKKWSAKEHDLTKFFKRHFTEYADEWEAKLAMRGSADSGR